MHQRNYVNSGRDHRSAVLVFAVAETLTTIDGNHLAGYVVSLDEEQNCMCHLLGCAPSAEECVVCDPLKRGFVVIERSQSGTRNHRIRANPRRELQGELAGQGEDSALADRMSREPGPWFEGREISDADDDATVVLQHHGSYPVGAVERAVHECVNGAVPGAQVVGGKWISYEH